MHGPKRHYLVRAMLAVALGSVVACTDGVTPPPSAVAGVQRAAAPIVELNPQPEPPSSALRFEVNPDGTDWYGTVYVGETACGYMKLLQTRSSVTGIVDHVGYSLAIQGDNPDYVLDAALSGIIQSHRVVLNGSITDGFYAGETIHPVGEIAPGTDGLVDGLTTMTGFIQLNPQPEPPSSAYPPSPCLGE